MKPSPPVDSALRGSLALARSEANGVLAERITLQDQNNQDVTLSSFRGERSVLVVFYPFAFSGICTGELTEIRDDLGRFVSDDVQVLTVSCDAMFSLRAYADRDGYFFPLLSDFWPHGEVARAYGVFDEAAGWACVIDGASAA